MKKRRRYIKPEDWRETLGVLSEYGAIDLMRQDIQHLEALNEDKERTIAKLERELAVQFEDDGL